MSIAPLKGQESGTNSPEWAAEWLKRVASGALTMSQRKLTSVEAHGGIDTLKRVAVELGVHLAVVVDDKDEQLVVASMHEFRIIC